MRRSHGYVRSLIRRMICRPNAISAGPVRTLSASGVARVGASVGVPGGVSDSTTNVVFRPARIVSPTSKDRFSRLAIWSAGRLAAGARITGPVVRTIVPSWVEIRIRA